MCDIAFSGTPNRKTESAGMFRECARFYPCQQSTIYSVEFNIGDTAAKARCRYHLPHLRFGAQLYQHLCTGYPPYLQRSLSIQSPSMAPPANRDLPSRMW